MLLIRCESTPDAELLARPPAVRWSQLCHEAAVGLDPTAWLRGPRPQHIVTCTRDLGVDGSREEGSREGEPVISVAIKEIDERATVRIDYY